ncbi:MAG: nitrous oxide reductase accessory protein NosL [Mucilaginibacter sp.]|uniref:nitrous oxide reductase accessory protein NosL n=1 Tax=Mucilaginibacter sp. TaxID=1882438 RepID=UPI0032634C99
MRKLIFLTLIIAVISLSACEQQFAPINYGHEGCQHCRMTIMDKRFAAELLTSKGKAFKFDDLSCLIKYMKDEHMNDAGIRIFVADYQHPDGQFLNAQQAAFVHDENLRSPMNGNIAAYASVAKVTSPIPHGVLYWTTLNK